MNIKLTVVYEVKEEKDAEEILQLFKTNEVMEFTEDGVRIIAWAQGDVMEERDVLQEAYVAAGEREHALREDLAMTSALLEASNESHIEWRKKLAAAEQRNAELEQDKARIDWLIEQPIDTFYLDDGRIIDIAGRVDVRDAIDEAMAKPTESGAIKNPH